MAEAIENQKISFIVPVLNGEKFIGQCLDHIMAEKAPDDEVIVVDNGSTDNTLEIARQYTGVKVLEWPGVTIATMRNRGVAASGGELLAFIDSDVLVTSGWRGAAISVLSDTSIKATGTICDIPESSTWIERAWWSFGRPVATRVNYINTGNLIVRREAFEIVGGFDELLVSDEDFDLGARLNQREYWMLDDPRVRAIHLGNAKTLAAFIRKEKWHATSIADGLSAGSADKAMVMTLLFMIFTIPALMALPLIWYYLPAALLILTAVGLVPIATAIYRAVQYGNARYFFYLVVFYFVFYTVRSVTILEIAVKKVLGHAGSKGSRNEPVDRQPENTKQTNDMKDYDR